MNKYLFVLGLVGTALFSACSTSDDLSVEEPNVLLPDDKSKETAILLEAGKDSEIPIALGVSGRGYTRAVMNPDASGNFETETGKYLGVFCLAMGTHSGVYNIPAIISANNWNTAPENDEAGLIVRMKNVPAKVTTDGATSDVTFLNPTTLSNPTPSPQSWFYPMGNWMWYNFYAYYPRQGDETLLFTPNQALQTNYVIDGSQDIIWGMANPEDAMYDDYAATDAKPYCAKYFRLKKGEVGEENIGPFLPKFVFKHKLVQFRFFVKAPNSTVRADLVAKHMQVTDMYISNAYYKLRLIVANKHDTQFNGSLYQDGSKTELRIKKNDSDVNRFDQNNDEVLDNPLDITVDAVDVEHDTPVGYIMLYPPSPLSATELESGFKYWLVLRVKYTIDEVEYTNDLSVDMVPPLIYGSSPESYGFQEGKVYNIVVNVQSPQEIHARAFLNAWDDSPAKVEYP